MCYYVLYRADICNATFDANVASDDSGYHQASLKFFNTEELALKFLVSLIPIPILKDCAEQYKEKKYIDFNLKWLSNDSWKNLSLKGLKDFWFDYLDLEGRENNNFTYGECKQI